jgi:WD40 repeat protein
MSSFSCLINVQHIGIRIHDPEGLYEQHLVEEPESNNKEEGSHHSEDSEQKSDNSGENEEVNVPGIVHKKKKPVKILIAKLSPNGMQLAIACPDETVAVFTLLQNHPTSRFLFDPNYHRLSKISQTQPPQIVNLCWSHVCHTLMQNSNLLLVATMDKLITVWVMNHPHYGILSTFSTNAVVTCLEFNPMVQSHLAIGTFDRYLRIHDMVTSTELEEINTQDIPTCVKFKGDGKSLLVGMLHGTIREYTYEGQYK